ncbi:MAG: metal-dependent hydrolase [Patescibacteria group bacterium]
MTFPTHIIAGLIVGKLTGQYGVAIAGALLIDVDHLYVYAREGLLTKPKLLWRTTLHEDDPYQGLRSFFHSIWSFGVISLIAYIFFPALAVSFIAGYANHLLLDGLDASDFWPFRPLSNWNLRGPIKYRSYSELALFLGLAMIFILLVIMK